MSYKTSDIEKKLPDVKFRFECINCGEVKFDKDFSTKKINCPVCNFRMTRKSKGQTLRTIKNILLVIAIAVLVYVSYSIYHTEKAKSAFREVRNK